MIFIAIGLAMDAFAVSISSGICIKKISLFHVLRACFFFGAFQALMPLAGWFLGALFKAYIAAFDHWIAFGLLVFIGGKMGFEALKEIFIERKKGAQAACDLVKTESGGITKLGTLSVLALATSVDALAVGVSLSLLGQGILLPAAVIGGITFILCLLGLEFGKRLGSAFGEWSEVIGGLALIGIGLKILIEHLSRHI